jgi:hypothetical protein
METGKDLPLFMGMITVTHVTQWLEQTFDGSCNIHDPFTGLDRVMDQSENTVVSEWTRGDCTGKPDRQAAGASRHTGTAVTMDLP